MPNPQAPSLHQLESLDAPALRRLLREHLTRRKLGLTWEADLIERDRALNSDVVLPRLCAEDSYRLTEGEGVGNLIIEGDNFDSLRLLRATHAGRIRVIYIDPPYNTGNRDWVYNDRYVGANDRWRHSLWLEFLYRRLTLARDLLTPDGVILVSINDENRARLEMLMDEVFPGRRVGSLVWKKRKSSNTSLDFHYSSDHEHVLIYAEMGFAFNGSKKTWDGYQNWDEVRKNWWSSGPLTLGFTKDQRPNLFYPLCNPQTNIWYPCDPKRVWVYASKSRLGEKKVRTQPMEVMIAEGLVNFPEEPEPACYSTERELRAAIRDGKAPPYLSTDSDLPFWVGKKIAYGRPRFKRFKDTLVNESMPLSSWCVDLTDPRDDGEQAVTKISSGRTSEGTTLLRELGMAEDFAYPKPLSLIKGLLQQATRADDIVLDFFAGSGTTGQAVLELNKEDGGNRRFVLCSSTEATEKEPEKNLCRDVCAARLKKVIERDHAGACFAYLRLEKFAHGRALFESEAENALHLLSLRYTQSVSLPPGAPEGVQVFVRDEARREIGALCIQSSTAALKALERFAAEGYALRVFSRQPLALMQRLRRKFEAHNRALESKSLYRALLLSQRRWRNTARRAEAAK